MKEVIKKIIIILIILGIGLSVMNFLSADTIPQKKNSGQSGEIKGTVNGDYCDGAPLNC